MTICRTCQTLDLVDTATGVVSLLKCRDWNCDNGKQNRITFWRRRVYVFQPEYMITITTRFSDFNRDNIREAQRLSARFLRALKYKGIKYISVTAYHGTIHYHIACRGTRPKQLWVKRKWMHLSGCYEVKVSDAHKKLPWYLIDKNAAQLPNHKEGETAWEGCTGNVFQRIRTSSNLFKKPIFQKPEKGRFRVFKRPDAESDAVDVDNEQDIATPPDGWR